MNNKPCILIIEDNPNTLLILVDLLETHNYQTRVAQNNVQVFEVIQHYTPDLILLDIMLPDSNGYDICTRLKQMESFKTVPIIFLSALSETFNKLKGFQVGGVDYIIKPFAREEVIARIKTHLTIRQQQLDIKQSKQYVESIINNFLDSLIVVNTEGCIQKVNPETCQILDYSQEDLIGQSIEMIFNEAPHHVHSIFTFYQNPKMSGQHNLRNIELTYKTRSGKLIPMSFNINLLQVDPSQKIMGVVAGGKNISDLHDTFKKLEQSDNRFRALFQTSPDIMMICTLSGEIFEINRLFVEKTGYRKEDVLNKTVIHLNFWGDDNYHDQIYALLEKHGSIRNIDCHFHTKEGQILDGLMSCSFLRINSRLYILYVIKTITDLFLAKKNNKKIEEQINHTQSLESIGIMASGIAHDFNNVLHPMLGFIEFLKDDENNQPEETIQLEKIKNQIFRGADLVTQILNLSKMKIDETQPLIIQDIIRNDIKLLKATLPSSIDIQISISDKCSYIYANPVHIHQIILNLCTNAAHAMKDQGGVMHIQLEQLTKQECMSRTYLCNEHDNYIKLSVSDTGHGISEKNLKMIFEPYFTTKSREQGTGLGLAIVNNIVITYKGVINAWSQEGKGSRFDVYLPCMTKQKNDAKEIEQPETIMHELDNHILFIDTEKTTIDMYKCTLNVLGYKITGTTNTQEALQLLEHQPNQFCIIVIDITILNISENEFTQTLRHIMPDIPIIITTWSDDNKITINQNLDIKAVLKKPFSVELLRETIQSIVAKDSRFNNFPI